MDQSTRDQGQDIPIETKKTSNTILGGLDEKPIDGKLEAYREFKFKCAKCKWGDDDKEAFKVHYKSGWHKHNLKLLVDGSEAVTEIYYGELCLMMQIEIQK